MPCSRAAQLLEALRGLERAWRQGYVTFEAVATECVEADMAVDRMRTGAAAIQEAIVSGSSGHVDEGRKQPLFRSMGS